MFVLIFVSMEKEEPKSAIFLLHECIFFFFAFLIIRMPIYGHGGCHGGILHAVIDFYL